MIGETVTHRKYVPAGYDEDGYKIPAGWKNVQVEHVGVDMGATYEPRSGTVERTVTDLTLFMPEGFVCDPRDRFIVRGSEYEVEGTVSPLKNMFTGTGFRTEVPLRRAT